MREYGNAVQYSGGEEIAAEEMEVIRKTLAFNYSLTKQKHPEWNLPENWQFVEGGRRQMYETVDCRYCKGDGEFDLYNDDGTLFEHYVCEPCGGVGTVPTEEVISGRYWYQFGWYVRVDE